ncbi:MAG: hypothetical protein WD397_09425 [Wenzhouxiangellaceae bacterium]
MPSAACNAHFLLLFCNRKKSLASASAAGGETAFEVEVDNNKLSHPAWVPKISAWRNGFRS